MKYLTTAVFESRDAAEKAVNRLHNKLNIPNENISFLYRNTDGEVREVSTHSISTKTPAEGAAAGTAIGGTIGALAGLAIIAGVIPVLGPVIASGALATALGITGAVGTAAVTTVAGAAAGGLIGALVSLGVGREHAQRYNDLVEAGNVLIVVYASVGKQVAEILEQSGATEVREYTPSV